MSALTQNERDGLEDVFLSINTENRFKKIKNISSYLISKNIALSTQSLLKRAKYELKGINFAQLMPFFDKKK